MRELEKEAMRARKWGVFNHFLYSPPGSAMPDGKDTVDWNARCELFDTDRLARDLHEMGAGYYFITLMQGRKYMAAPNAAFDAIAGTKPGEACARRDLIADLIRSLKKYDIALCLYFTGDGPYKDEEIGTKFGFLNPRQNVTTDFCEKWASVLEEYAVRYGDDIKMWWIDGCYDYFGYDAEKLAIYERALRKGSEHSLITFNNGVKEDLYNWYPGEDFTSGEFNFFTCIPKAPVVGESLPHILAPLGISADGSEWGAWGQGGCKHDAVYMRDYIRRVNTAGGIVSVDIEIRYDSTFDPDQAALLKQL